MRVVEDYARFALNDDNISRELKQLRHDLAAAIGSVLGMAILHRDTPGDVGTDNKTESEGRREGLSAVVIAAGKRLGEALRVIEECLKVPPVPSPAESGAEPPVRALAALAVEGIRYRFYDLELRIARTLAPAIGWRTLGSMCSSPNPHVGSRG